MTKYLTTCNENVFHRPPVGSSCGATARPPLGNPYRPTARPSRSLVVFLNTQPVSSCLLLCIQQSPVPVELQPSPVPELQQSSVTILQQFPAPELQLSVEPVSLALPIYLLVSQLPVSCAAAALLPASISDLQPLVLLVLQRLDSDLDLPTYIGGLQSNLLVVLQSGSACITRIQDNVQSCANFQKGEKGKFVSTTHGLKLWSSYIVPHSLITISTWMCLLELHSLIRANVRLTDDLQLSGLYKASEENSGDNPAHLDTTPLYTNILFIYLSCFSL